jgi:ferredoxin
MLKREETADPAAARRQAGGVKEQLRLRVDPIGCTGHGICAELLPELIRLDDWGYPIIKDVAIRAPLMDDVSRTIAACPALALRLQRTRADVARTAKAGR